MTTTLAPWQPPQFTMPMPFRDPPREWRLLGEHRGRRWWSSKWGELEESDQLTQITNATAGTLIGPLLIERDELGREAGRRLRLYRPGTFAGFQVPKPTPPAAAKADFMVVGDALVPLVDGCPIDALTELTRFRTEGAYSERHAIRGAPAILAHLGGKRGDRLVGPLVDAYALLHPAVRDGRPPVCAFGCGATAMTTAEAAPAPIAWCGEPCQKEANR